MISICIKGRFKGGDRPSRRQFRGYGFCRPKCIYLLIPVIFISRLYSLYPYLISIQISVCVVYTCSLSMFLFRCKVEYFYLYIRVVYLQKFSDIFSIYLSMYLPIFYLSTCQSIYLPINL